MSFMALKNLILCLTAFSTALLLHYSNSAQCLLASFKISSYHSTLFKSYVHHHHLEEQLGGVIQSINWYQSFPALRILACYRQYRTDTYTNIGVGVSLGTTIYPSKF